MSSQAARCTWDTMAFYAFLRSEAAKLLFTRIETGTIQAYTSVLTFDELTYKLLLALIRDHYAGSPLDYLRDQEEAMIAEFYPRLAPSWRSCSLIRI